MHDVATRRVVTMHGGTRWEGAPVREFLQSTWPKIRPHVITILTILLTSAATYFGWPSPSVAPDPLNPIGTVVRHPGPTEYVPMGVALAGIAAGSLWLGGAGAGRRDEGDRPFESAWGQAALADAVGTAPDALAGDGGSDDADDRFASTIAAAANTTKRERREAKREARERRLNAAQAREHIAGRLRERVAGMAPLSMLSLLAWALRIVGPVIAPKMLAPVVRWCARDNVMGVPETVALLMKLVTEIQPTPPPQTFGVVSGPAPDVQPAKPLPLGLLVYPPIMPSDDHPVEGGGKTTINARLKSNGYHTH
jgi:hypothetical protein